MTELEQEILDIIQDGFPIEERPYEAIARILDEKSLRLQTRPTEQQVFDVVENLRQSGVIRRLGGVYDTKRLGLVSRLCAGKVPESPLDFSDAPHGETPMEQFARTVTGISAITHNYIRSHEYNVWFTIIAESDSSIQKILDKLCAETSLHDTHSMPATRMFKINTVMKSAECEKRKAERSEVCKGNPISASAIPDPVRNPHTSSLTLSGSDRNRIRLLSGDLPHTLTPFRDLNVDLDAAREDLAMKRMRRFGAVLRHQEAGFPCNAMVCFCIDERRETRDERGSGLMSADETGSFLAKNSHVSHCYERPAFEGFPYKVYAMFHASTEKELDQFIQDSVNALGCPKYAVLRSLRELKKTSYRYFAD